MTTATPFIGNMIYELGYNCDGVNGHIDIDNEKEIIDGFNWGKPKNTFYARQDLTLSHRSDKLKLLWEHLGSRYSELQEQERQALNDRIGFTATFVRTILPYHDWRIVSFALSLLSTCSRTFCDEIETQKAIPSGSRQIRQCQLLCQKVDLLLTERTGLLFTYATTGNHSLEDLKERKARLEEIAEELRCADASYAEARDTNLISYEQDFNPTEDPLLQYIERDMNKKAVEFNKTQSELQRAIGRMTAH